MREPAAVAAAVALAVAGCGSHHAAGRRARLLDGSQSAALPTMLNRLGRDAVAARVRVLRVNRLDARNRACVESFRGEFTVGGDAVVVENTGVIGASLTFVDARRRAVLGCDRTSTRSADGSWCARSIGRLVGGELEDARLDILCVDRHGAPVGFAWLEPEPDARWVAIAGAGGNVVEPVAAGLPVRVATRNVDDADSSATFDISEYDSRGRELARYRLRARVAG
jgi:hypothetical protein